MAFSSRTSPLTPLAFFVLAPLFECVFVCMVTFVDSICLKVAAQFSPFLACGEL